MGLNYQDYGLAKVHKRSYQFFQCQDLYKILNQITKWLSEVPKSKINSSSKKTVDQLKSVILEQDEVMISFDVTLLYTNVPVEEEVQNVANRLYCGEFEQAPIDKATFIYLTKLATKDVIMLTHDGPY